MRLRASGARRGHGHHVCTRLMRVPRLFVRDAQRATGDLAFCRVTSRLWLIAFASAPGRMHIVGPWVRPSRASDPRALLSDPFLFSPDLFSEFLLLVT